MRMALSTSNCDSHQRCRDDLDRFRNNIVPSYVLVADIARAIRCCSQKSCRAESFDVHLSEVLIRLSDQFVACELLDNKLIEWFVLIQ